jgi:hypothetical protein
LNRQAPHESGELTFHAQHSLLIRYFFFFLAFDLALAILLFFCLSLASSFFFAGQSHSPSLVISLQIFCMFFSLLTVSIGIWTFSFTIFTFRRLVSHKPTLSITIQGIHFHDIPLTGTMLLSWSEIRSLSTTLVHQTFSQPANHICIEPKSPIQFLSHFSPPWRIFIRLSSQATGTLIHVPQWLLAEPVDEILFQIQEIFQEKLLENRIQVFK